MTRFFSFKSCCLFLLLLCINSSSFGWNRATHMAIGAIAYRDMQAKSPRRLARVLAILRQHPDINTRWAPMLRDSSLTPAEKDEYLFMLAARWPDDIRGQNNPNDHPSWHYINYVYNPAKGTARTDTTLGTGETILQAYALNRQILTSNAPDSSKAIALCWLFHLTGDVHMPLHTAALVSPQFPDGDRGGNLFKIKVSISNPTLNLHAFWDNMLLGTDTYRSADQLALQLAEVHKRRQVPHRCSRDMGLWSRESFELARSTAYKEGTLTAGTGDNGVVLPTDYMTTVKPVAEQQVAFSGHRLATLLRKDVRK